MMNMASFQARARKQHQSASSTRLTVLSLGAGVQSTAMALMAAHGLVKKPDFAIFADTQWEPKSVYEHLKWLQSGVLDFPIHIVSAGNLKQDVLNRVIGHRVGQKSRNFEAVPWHTLRPDGVPGIGRRECTSEYKLKPIVAEIRGHLNVEPGRRIPKNSVEVLLGISIDEAHRMKPSRTGWIVNTYPLIEKGISRAGCLEWISDKGVSHAASICLFGMSVP